MRNRLAITPYLTLAERNTLDTIKPWIGKQWSEKVEKNGTDYTDDISAIKSKIITALTDATDNYCVYCDSKFEIQSDPEIEHFVRKDKYPQFTFELNNLFPSCHKCNFSTRKGRKDTIRKLHRKYAKCKFKYVHPHYDNPEKHFAYFNSLTPPAILIQWLTKKGKKTINMFKLNGSALTEDRAKSHIFDNLNASPVYDAVVADIMGRSYSR